MRKRPFVCLTPINSVQILILTLPITLLAQEPIEEPKVAFPGLAAFLLGISEEW